ncbi:alpha-glucosidase [Naematelia encephala]|uniref:Alpha-glucosidase n=1 Tax=Naematelia encephala TaxID=71784 RepID=A0A1Y2AKU7_9TREE|nr:alpha-glucosidase [Naematelia encephala]
MTTTVQTAPQHFQERALFKECCIYQVYPASYADSNGDGMGDIPGLVSKLDYLKDLGVDVIWLSPVFKSPFIDNGYDVSDYQAIDPRFGTLEDVDILIDEMHKREMKLVMDLIVNHTSDQHPWFVEARKSKDNPYRDFFWWRPPRFSPEGERLPPNNWREEFSNGSAWEWDEVTQEYYLHLYTKEQPDLNWENPAVRTAVYEDIMKWWLKRGCDGFRMDVINLISKDPKLPDASVRDPNETFQWPYEHCANGPRIHEFLQEMYREVGLDNPNLITVGETPFTHHDFDVLVPYVLPENKELQMIFQFEQQEVDGYPQLVPRDYLLSELKAITSRWQVGMQERGGWNSIFLENHDVARSVSRFGDVSTPEHRAASAKLLSAMQCTLSGTLYIYQGEEIAMANVPTEWPIEEYKDVASQAYYYEELAARKIKQGIDDPDLADVWDGLRRKARDHARTPMQWDGTLSNAGFSKEGAEPWMRVHDDYREWNVATQKSDSNSVLSFWKRMLAFRKKYLSCTYGIYTLLSPDDEKIYAYTKDYKEERSLVLLNFSKKSEAYAVPAEVGLPEKITDFIGNFPGDTPDVQGGTMRLRPYEAIVLVYQK